MRSTTPFQNALYGFAATDLAPHCNPVTCVLAGRDRPLVVKAAGHKLEGDIVIIRPEVVHEVEIRGRARVLYLNGLAFPGASDLADVLSGPIEAIAGAALGGDEDAQKELRAHLDVGESVCPPALAHVLSDIAADPMRRMTQLELADALGMERTRALRHFKRVTGMTYRRFKQWSGLQFAAHLISRGELARTAAFDGGFADSAHLSRTFRASFGVTPIEVTPERIG